MTKNLSRAGLAIVIVSAIYPLSVMASHCDEMSVYNESSGMCEGRAMPGMPGMPMGMAMLHENIFGTQIFEEGARGVNALAAPSMLMGDLGHSVADRHYVNLDLMLTSEKWTFPKNGSPELLQIGETKANGEPFLDAQHPHSSPIMGLTLSDTISLSSEQGELKFFSPLAEKPPKARFHSCIGPRARSIRVFHWGITSGKMSAISRVLFLGACSTGIQHVLRSRRTTVASPSQPKLI